MPFIFFTLVLVVASFAQSYTWYLDGQQCPCDSIVTTESVQQMRALFGVTPPYLGDGGLVREFPMVNGKVHGLAKSYYRNSVSVHSVVPIINGVAQGTAKGFEEDGSLRTTLPLVQGEIHGEVRVYNSNGLIQTKSTYERGVKQRLVIVYTYYDNGRLHLKIPYVEGVLHGDMIEYDMYTGRKIRSTSYVQGKEHGYEKYYWEDGFSVIQVSPIVNGVLQGVVNYYSRSGQLVGTALYMDNKLVGHKECIDGRKGNEWLDCTSNIHRR